MQRREGQQWEDFSLILAPRQYLLRRFLEQDLPTPPPFLGFFHVPK